MFTELPPFISCFEHPVIPKAGLLTVHSSSSNLSFPLFSIFTICVEVESTSTPPKSILSGDTSATGETPVPVTDMLILPVSVSMFSVCDLSP